MPAQQVRCASGELRGAPGDDGAAEGASRLPAPPPMDCHSRLGDAAAAPGLAILSVANGRRSRRVRTDSTRRAVFWHIRSTDGVPVSCAGFCETPAGCPPRPRRFFTHRPVQPTAIHSRKEGCRLPIALMRLHWRFHPFSLPSSASLLLVGNVDNCHRWLGIWSGAVITLQ